MGASALASSGSRCVPELVGDRVGRAVGLGEQPVGTLLSPAGGLLRVADKLADQLGHQLAQLRVPGGLAQCGGVPHVGGQVAQRP
ncbi:MAG: hypothetical protein LC685_02435 [Actinobacteria bacterium]|nr:hypothetical protein [Actinomycetota bacterium]